MANNKFRIAIGQLQFEGNSQSPVKTTLSDFQNIMLATGNDVIDVAKGVQTELSGAFEILQYFDVEIVPLIAAYGNAGGYVTEGAFQTLHSMLRKRLLSSDSLDGVYLALHGAFITENDNDIDGLILEDVRAIVGNIPIAVSLDLHGNITRKMAENADFMIGYRHYPHDDAFDTGRRTAGLLLRMLKKEIRPVMSVRRTPMIAACQNQNTKGDAPLAKIHAKARCLEYAGEILAASYFPVQHGFDFPDMSYATVVISDNNKEIADNVALELAHDAWSLRHAFDVHTVRPDFAILQGRTVKGKPIVLSDASDTIGGGATGDSAFMLGELLRHAGDDRSAMIIIDPETVEIARGFEKGQLFNVRIGNKHSDIYGKPIEIEACLCDFIDDCRFTYTGGCSKGVEGVMGATVVLEIGSVTVVVPSLPTYEYADEQFRAAGINPEDYKFVVIKNPMNYQQAFAYSPALYDLDTPGPTTCNICEPQWIHLDRPIYPIDDDFEPHFECF